MSEDLDSRVAALEAQLFGMVEPQSENPHEAPNEFDEEPMVLFPGGDEFEYSFRALVVTEDDVQKIAIRGGYVICDPIGSVYYQGGNITPTDGQHLVALKVYRGSLTVSGLELWPQSTAIGYDASYIIVPICDCTVATNGDATTITITLQHQLGNVHLQNQI